MKTLKELRRMSDYSEAIFDDEDNVVSGHKYWYEQSDLKQAAIEWVKELRGIPKGLGDRESVTWIKLFFNLTDEDLN